MSRLAVFISAAQAQHILDDALADFRERFPSTTRGLERRAFGEGVGNVGRRRRPGSSQPATSATSTELIGQLLERIPDPASPPPTSPKSSWMNYLRNSPEPNSEDHHEVTSKPTSSESPKKPPTRESVRDQQHPDPSTHHARGKAPAAPAWQPPAPPRPRTRYPDLPGPFPDESSKRKLPILPDTDFSAQPKAGKRPYRRYDDVEGVPPKINFKPGRPAKTPSKDPQAKRRKS